MVNVKIIYKENDMVFDKSHGRKMACHGKTWTETLSGNHNRICMYLIKYISTLLIAAT